MGCSFSPNWEKWEDPDWLVSSDRHICTCTLPEVVTQRVYVPPVKLNIKTNFQIDNYNMQDLGELIKKYEVKATLTGNDLSDPIEFNLMFATSIGPSGLIPG